VIGTQEQQTFTFFETNKDYDKETKRIKLDSRDMINEDMQPKGDNIVGFNRKFSRL
jgi:hypothetical protein